MKAKITKIFRSIQGEGEYLGADQIFLRFFDCNLNCSWCDTTEANGTISNNFDEFTVDEVITSIKLLNTFCHSVSLTGGEPLLQKDFIKELSPKIHDLKLPVYLETNGTLVDELKDVIDLIDIVSMDIKLPSSTDIEEDLWKRHAEFLKIAKRKKVFVKVVVTNETDISDLEKAADLVSNVDPEITFIIQPNNYDEPNEMIKICRKFQDKCFKKLRDVRIIPQMHKVWGIP